MKGWVRMRRARVPENPVERWPFAGLTEIATGKPARLRVGARQRSVVSSMVSWLFEN